MGSYTKGRHTDRDTVVVELIISRDQFGRITSEHKLQADSDLQLVESWPSGGLEQVAFALLVEAVRREALLDAILLLSSRPEVGSTWKSSTDTEKGVITGDLSQAVLKSLGQVISRLAPTASRAALDLVASAELPGV